MVRNLWKQERLIELAVQYVAQHHLQDRLCRFDVVLLRGRHAGTSPFQHIQNAREVAENDLRW